MKIRRPEGNDPIIARSQDGRVGEQIAARAKAGDSSLVASEGLGGELQKTSRDTIAFSSLGAMLRQELDPAKMAAERRAKIEALKEQIRNGTYAPPVEAVAESVREEIALEVLLSGQPAQEA